MTLEVTTPYASGTVVSATGKLITLATGTADSSWVGRAFRLASSIADRGGQWKKITAVNSATEIELEAEWSTSFDTANPRYEYLPQNGDQFYISHLLDDIDDGTNIVRQTDLLYENAGGLILRSNAFLYIENQAFNFGDCDVASDALVAMETTCAYIIRNALISFDFSTTSATVLTLNVLSSSGSTGDFICIDSVINILSNNANVNPFFRLNRGQDQRAIFERCVFNGKFAGRIEGLRSWVQNCKFLNNSNSFCPITTLGIVEISDVEVLNSSQAVYWSFNLSGSGQITNITGTSLTDYAIFLNDGNLAADSRVFFVTLDYDNSAPALVFWNNRAINKTLQIGTVASVVSERNGVLEGSTIALYDKDGVEISNETSGTGSFNNVNLPAYEFTKTDDSSNDQESQILGDGAARFPYRLRGRKYGCQYISLSLNILNTASFPVPESSYTYQLTADPSVTAVDSAAALAVTNPTTANQQYDHHQATAIGQMVHEVLLSTLDGSTLTYNCNITIDSDLTAISYDWPARAISVSAATNGTFRALALGAGQSLSLQQTGTQPGSWSIPSTGKVVLGAAGSYDLSAFAFANGATIEVDGITASVTVPTGHSANITLSELGGGSLTVEEIPISFTAPQLTTATFNNVRCRLSLVPGSPPTIADDGSVTSGALAFTPTDVNNSAITLTGITGKLNTDSVIRFYGSDVPEGIDTRAVYYPSVDYAGDDILFISTSPGGSTLALTDSGTGVMHASLWTELDQSLVTTGPYQVNLGSAATTAGINLETGDQLVLQAVHHTPPGTTPVVASRYLEQTLQFEGASITALASLEENVTLGTFAATQGRDGSQVTGIILDPSTPGKIQLDTSVTELSSADAALFFYYVRWASALNLLRNNLEVLGENEIKIIGQLTLDAAVPCVVNGPFTYRADGGFLQAVESETISFQWRNLLGFTQVVEIPFNLSPEVLQGFQSLLSMTATILENQQSAEGGSLTPGQVQLLTDAATASRLTDLTEDDAGSWRFTANALEQAPAGGSGGSGDATAANQASILSAIADMQGATFDPATDSLEALRNRGDAEWTTATGFSTHSAADIWNVVTRSLTDAVDIGSGSISAIQSGLSTLQSGDVQLATTAALNAYDPPTRAELTADKDEVLSAIAMGGGSGGDATSANQTAILDSLSAIQGTGFEASTDSLEALRDRGDSAWVTADGFSTHSPADVWSVATRSLTDKAGFSLSTAGIQAIWDALTSALTTAGSIGRLIAEKLGVSGTLAHSGDAETYKLSTAAIRAAVGLSTANLDTQLNTIDGNVDSVLEDTSTTLPSAIAALPTPDNTGITSATTAAQAAQIAAEAVARGRFANDFNNSEATQYDADGNPYQVFDLVDENGNPATSPLTAVERRPQP